MKRLHVPLIAIGAALVALVVARWLHTYERVDEWIDLPRTGEAATNPLFGLRVALEKDGRRVHAWRRLAPEAMHLAPTDTLLYDGDIRAISTPVRRALLDWVRRGGHLIVALPAPDAALDVFTHRDATHVGVPLLDEIGVRMRRGTGGCIGDGDTAIYTLCGTRRFDVPPGTAQRIGDDEGDVLARVRVGAGSVDVVGSLEFVDTDRLEQRTNAAFAHQLISGGDAHGVVHLVHSSDMPSLWMTLVSRGWPVWLPLALLLAGWMWARMRHFGPLIPSPTLERRSLLEHVAASGQHQWRYGRADALYAALLDAFQARLRRRDPQAAALQGEAQTLRLVERTGLPHAQVIDALTPPDPRDAKALATRIATLVRMRNRL
ncbi:DUF4350 domain-containing protein [Cognatilysobacter terrigena]|uniref:DUF4350 domain-containing protein n=1 Tax=Cognatilysobacter terrigena TaxID=2488749 RepID=UPI00105D219F|nr:DUF4350 domain-containing protein [Lysobacter terrigena]